MDAALCAPLPVGPTAGVTACPKAAVTETAAAANVADKRKSRRRTPMATSLSWFRRHLSGNATAVARAPEGARDVCTGPIASRAYTTTCLPLAKADVATAREKRVFDPKPSRGLALSNNVLEYA